LKITLRTVSAGLHDNAVGAGAARGDLSRKTRWCIPRRNRVGQGRRDEQNRRRDAETRTGEGNRNRRGTLLDWIRRHAIDTRGRVIRKPSVRLVAALAGLVRLGNKNTSVAQNLEGQSLRFRTQAKNKRYWTGAQRWAHL
jgi:hypothetical protein